MIVEGGASGVCHNIWWSASHFFCSVIAYAMYKCHRIYVFCFVFPKISILMCCFLFTSKMFIEVIAITARLLHCLRQCVFTFISSKSMRLLSAPYLFAENGMRNSRTEHTDAKINSKKYSIWIDFGARIPFRNISKRAPTPIVHRHWSDKVHIYT